ncbi:endothelin receptor type B-like [Branchiostoma floridae]|uniref:Endothelin receptor type B-like n=1 Tax=Branchiostoma floridae TaxID=7739 RepID=A0A9J7LGG1_BRAFL|nr:endothelin receptor type B-like [Branchiostoma floridae]
MASSRLVVSVHITAVFLWSSTVLGEWNTTSASSSLQTSVDGHLLQTDSFATLLPGHGSTSYSYTTETPPNSTSKPNRKEVGCKIRIPRPSETADLPCPSPITVDHAAKITHIILSAVIFALGLTGNSLVIRIVATKPDMRNAPNVLLAGLACGDLLFILLCVPLTAYNLYTVPTDWIFGTAMCKLLPFLQQTSLGVTVLSLMALSADRYTAVVSSTMSRLSQSWRGLGVRLALIWSLAALSAVPAAVSYTTRSVPWHGGNITVCGMDQESPFARTYNRWRVWLRFALYFCLPLAVTAVHYSLMAKHMMTVDRLHRNTRGMDDRMTKRRRAARVVLCIVALFAVCWLPFHLTNILRITLPCSVLQNICTFSALQGEIISRPTPHVALFALCWLPFHLTNILRITLPCSVLQNICTFSALQGAHHFGLTLGSFNSCVNPIALYILSRKYKLYMDSLLFCCCSQGGGGEILDPRRGSTWTSRQRPSCDVSSLSVAARLLRRQEAFSNESTRSSGLEMGSQAGDSSERNSSVAME